MRAIPWDFQPDGEPRLSERLLSACDFPVGVYSPRFGLSNLVGAGSRTLTSSAGLERIGPTGGEYWALSSGNYVDVGNIRALQSRDADNSTSITILALARLDAVGNFPMLFSHFNGTSAVYELRGNSGTGRPSIVCNTTSVEVTATLANSFVGAGAVPIVATFKGSTTISGSSPSRAAIWGNAQFAEASGGDGLIRTAGGTARIGVRAGGTTLPWTGQLHDMIVLSGAIPDDLAEEIASDRTQFYRTCYAARRVQIFVTAPAPPALPTLSLPRAKAGSITATGFVPQWTAS
jgi:hypothetical protein